ncbi:hypothetical protein RRG08_027357 [Elysia crispata]|uniref:Uncharacterized protein n=1 Tax=Elysia crispata TaxID=231223 RepID=A0AAE1D0T6_9GAST|nr:hypothetical protein RRG08_027357 [Elysia crispata]
MQVQRAVEAFSAFISPLEVEDGLVSLASASISDGDSLKLEAFVCKLYGKTSRTSVTKESYDNVRQRFKFKGKKCALSNNGGIDLCQMPPCSQDVVSDGDNCEGESCADSDFLDDTSGEEEELETDDEGFN